jgi:excisionase family DNA binding protein
MDVMDAPVLITMDAAAARMSMCLRTVQYLVSDGQLASIKIGQSRRIPVSAIDDYVARRLSESPAA